MGYSFSLEFDRFLRSLKQSSNKPFSILLGAGASIESGIPSANDCIWEWKKDIFLSQNNHLIESYNVKLDSVRKEIQQWLDAQGEYPKEGSPEEYSFYAEKAFLSDDERRCFFEKIVEGHEPSLGYHLISILAQTGLVKYVWTTNFDGLMQKCAHRYNPLIPIEITSETSDRIRHASSVNELFCIELHGDYKYGKLKNTERELENQDEKLIQALSKELQDHDLIVIGYSGRDNSLLNALLNIYSEAGRGRLFWCGYGNDVNNSVYNFLNSVNDKGRKAYYVSSEGFDSLLYSISRYCLGDDKSFLLKIDNIKKDLSTVSFSTHKAPFKDFNGHICNIAKTNIFPIKYPTNCFQFEIDEKIDCWKFCEYLYSNEIMAVPYNKKIYAWGNSNKIAKLCTGKLKSLIQSVDIDQKLFRENGTFKNLILKTIVYILAKNNNLSYSKNKIWDSSDTFTYKKQLVYNGIRLKLVFSDECSFISFSPVPILHDKLNYSKSEIKEIYDSFYSHIDGMQANKNENNYIMNWKNKLIKGDRLNTYFPNTDNSFPFVIGGNAAYIGLISASLNSYSELSLENPKQVIAKGKEFSEPLLSFYSREKKAVVTHSHPMLGINNNAPIDYPINTGLFSDKISLGVICPASYEGQLHSFLEKLNKISSVQNNFEYLIDFPGFFNAFKTNLNFPDSSSSSWHTVNYPQEKNKYAQIMNFIKNIEHIIDQLSSVSDVVIIYIPEQYETVTLYESNNKNINLHDYIKAYAAQKQISTQFIREKTLRSNLICQILWSLSLAIYVKSGRIPWAITEIQKDTAFAGIGYSIQSKQDGLPIVIGCSHIYSSDGQGMKYRLSKVQDVTYDARKNPYLSEDEAYRLGIGIKELFYKSFSELPKRVVIHKRTPFKNEEIKGLVESLSSSGIKDIELLEINYDESFKCFSCKKDQSIDEFPVKRGLCFYFNHNAMYLYTHGICPSVNSTKRKYLKGGKALPKPLKIVRHYGNGDISQIAREILSLTKMNWNSFDLYSKLPSTLESSSEIARIGCLLSSYEGVSYDYRFFM